MTEHQYQRSRRTTVWTTQSDEPNLVKILKDSGYHVAWAGKRGDTLSPGVVEESTHFYAFDQRPEMMFEFSNKPRNDIDARTFYHGRRRSQKDDAPCFDFDEAATCTAERLLLE